MNRIQLNKLVESIVRKEVRKYHSINEKHSTDISVRNMGLQQSDGDTRAIAQMKDEIVEYVLDRGVDEGFNTWSKELRTPVKIGNLYIFRVEVFKTTSTHPMKYSAYNDYILYLPCDNRLPDGDFDQDDTEFDATNLTLREARTIYNAVLRS